MTLISIIYCVLNLLALLYSTRVFFQPKQGNLREYNATGSTMSQNIQIIVADKEDVKEFITDTMVDIAKSILPELIRQATQKQWLTNSDVRQLTGWSSRTLGVW